MNAPRETAPSTDPIALQVGDVARHRPSNVTEAITKVETDRHGTWALLPGLGWISTGLLEFVSRPEPPAAPVNAAADVRLPLTTLDAMERLFDDNGSFEDYQRVHAWMFQARELFLAVAAKTSGT